MTRIRACLVDATTGFSPPPKNNRKVDEKLSSVAISLALERSLRTPAIAISGFQRAVKLRIRLRFPPVSPSPSPTS